MTIKIALLRYVKAFVVTLKSPITIAEEDGIFLKIFIVFGEYKF